jgi:hypothetical protein
MVAPKKRVPLGQPLQLTEKQLDELSKVTPADIAKAQVFWRARAPKKYTSLLDAQTVDDQNAEDDQQ